MRGTAVLTIRFLVLLALLVRLPSTPPSVLVIGPDMLAGLAICHADDPADDPGKPYTPTQDCARCSACVLAWHAMPAAWVEPLTPAGRLIAVFRVVPPATGPPLARSLLPQPRGPPV